MRSNVLKPLPPEDMGQLGALLDEALDQAWVAVQPIRRARDGAAVGWEALLRTHAEGLPGPLDILEAARRLDRTDDVGRRARRLAAGVHRAGTELFVNLWPTDLLDPDLGSVDCPLRPFADQVILEITEHLPLETMPGLQRRLTELRRIGFRLAVDDFGAGHAGLSSWARIEPEILKVDRRITSGLPECRAMRRILGGALELARQSGSVVVAEGIETVAQLRTCVEAGCDLLQGYLLGMPAAPEQAEPALNVAWGP